ncbi:MAG: hypothetical protein ACERLB_00270 [Gammaproteobacteria bacterium]
MFRLLLNICFLPGTGANHARDRKIGIVTIASLLVLQFGPGQAAEIKDPMRPPEYALQKFRLGKYKNSTKPVIAVKMPEVKSMKLTSIIYSPTRKIAIIDDQMLSVGGIINGAKLVRIDKHGARLVRKGKVIHLRLPDDLTAVKKTLVESDT